ncbi:MAG: hypothetical protein C5B52_08245 [Bacteroidetes bacterium]|nr:MAG: hypothetical protein C5B52_08245 [Bacteroidota bacterium]
MDAIEFISLVKSLRNNIEGWNCMIKLAPILHRKKTKVSGVRKPKITQVVDKGNFILYFVAIEG